MSAAANRPVAFYGWHGIVEAWNFASKYAGKSGHLATLPEIVELRLGAEPGTNDSPWENWYTSTSAEYVGVGMDGRIKIIVAHGVGPMSTIDGIKAAYKWEWGDKTRCNNGGRISAQEFLSLEAGKYGRVRHVIPNDLIGQHERVIRMIDIAPVNVLDFQDYLDATGLTDGFNVFYRYLSTPDALRDPLIRMRLGSNAYRYLMKHERIAKDFHAKERPNDEYRQSEGLDDRDHPYITRVESSPNCTYTVRSNTTDGRTEEPRIPEEGYALAHLLNIEQFMRMHTAELGVMLATSPGVYEWFNGAKFVAVPPGATLKQGVLMSPRPDRAIRANWEHFMQAAEDDHTPVVPFLLEQSHGEWFTRYTRASPHEQSGDDRDVEFHVRSVEQVGDDGHFTTDEMFALRYNLTQVRAIMPREANAYEIVDHSPKGRDGLTTVWVRFYIADVDTSRRLPRTAEVARNYDRLMEVFVR